MANVSKLNEIVDLADRLLLTATAADASFKTKTSVGGEAFEATLPEGQQAAKKQQFNADLARLRELAAEIKEF